MHRTKFPEVIRCHFTNIQKQLPAPFVVVYTYFESVLKPVGEDVNTTQGVAALRISHLHLVLITDVDKYHSIENSYLRWNFNHLHSSCLC